MYKTGGNFGILSKILSTELERQNMAVWSNGKINELITLIEEREIIWNVTSEFYYNKIKRRDAVLEIIQKLNITGKYCQS